MTGVVIRLAINHTLLGDNLLTVLDGTLNLTLSLLLLIWMSSPPKETITSVMGGSMTCPPPPLFFIVDNALPLVNKDPK